MGCNPSDQGCGLNIIRQVGVLLGEHRGWILRIASLIKIEKQHNPSFLLIHIVDSIFHHLLRRWSPFLSRTGNVLHAFLFLAFLFLRFRKVEEV